MLLLIKIENAREVGEDKFIFDYFVFGFLGVNGGGVVRGIVGNVDLILLLLF